ncbi:MAG: putative ATPase superfamily [Firmicutes bacterium]|nr:putative ATPase superfamily [Bacillota bacterium]
MHRIYSRLLLYSGIGEESILGQLAEVFRAWEEDSQPETVLRRRVLTQVKRLLDLATENGFDENLWHNYLSFLLMTTENSFSLTCERMGRQGGSVEHFALQDCQTFMELFQFDFGPIEKALNLDCFSILQNYHAIPKKERRYNKTVSEQVQKLSQLLGSATSGNNFFRNLTDYYRDVGVGLFGSNRAFRIQTGEDGLAFLPINNTDGIRLVDLVGYELQKERLRYNTEAFLEGRPANNVLLYGDSGTGKSSSVKALINEYYDRGLRMIELYKHQFTALSQVIAAVKNRNYRFVILIDDLSFEEDEVEYKFLKAVIEGGVETRPENLLLYATSNRRHLIRETWKDRGDMEFNGEIHRSDTVEEKLSLSSRFGMQINYSTPSREEFKTIVRTLAKRQGISISEEDLLAEANKWELRHGGISGRTAQQFINYLAGER